MARMRSMKPEYFKDQDLAEDLPGPEGRDARLLYPGLWCLADEHGRLRGDARSIKGELFAFDDDMTAEYIERLVGMLVATGRAVRYTVGRSAYLYLTKLAGHQRLEPHKTPSRLPVPPPSESDPIQSENFPEHPGASPEEFGLKHVASSKEHVAGSRAENPGELPAKTAQAVRLVVAAAACTPELAEAVVLAIARQRKPRNLPGLVRRLIDAGELGPWFDTAQRAAGARASPAGELCPHGTPDGLEPIASTGEPRCPQCRKQPRRRA